MESKILLIGELAMTKEFIFTILCVFLMSCAHSGTQVANSKLPDGFVYLRDVSPSIIQDMKYAGKHNFVGKPINGYLTPQCILTQQTANSLARVQLELLPLT